MTNLLASLNTKGEKHLLIGYSNITYLRIKSIIESGALPILVCSTRDALFNPAIKILIEEHKLVVIDQEEHQITSERVSQYINTLGRDEVDSIVDRVFVTLPQSQDQLKLQIYAQCRRLRVPINTTDDPKLCTFTLLSTYNSGDFQVGVTTNGKGCKLASRLKRDIVSHLPSNIGQICDKIGELRRTIQEQDLITLEEVELGENDDDNVVTHKFNALVHEFDQTQEEEKLRRNRWLSQIVEYYPLNKLADLSIEDLKIAYESHKHDAGVSNSTAAVVHSREKKKPIASKRGKIALVGSGPGSTSLLTLGALQAIHEADFILADKLVPQQVLDLIPKTHGPQLFIARKFPGNAERAQLELLELATTALGEGKYVVRLKQGDPYIFGRGGEEYNYFQSQGYTPIVIPGISSALAAPVLAQIPMTHRDVADQLLVCTGTGRKGAVPNIPVFEPSRTTVFLMALHRIVELIPILIDQKGWVADLPVCIIERASCPDQRVIRTTLANVGAAVEACGLRPPGLLVTGYACEVIWSQMEKEIDAGGQGWIIEEGFDCGFNEGVLNVV